MKSNILYRCFDADSRLLYIGITANPPRRFRHHRGVKDWWAVVANIQLQTFETREALEAAEQSAIQSEQPRYNVAYLNPGTRPRREPPTVPLTAVQEATGLSYDELFDRIPELVWHES